MKPKREAPSQLRSNGDRSLWCAVILQALEDGMRPLPASAMKGGIFQGTVKMERDQARLWFRASSPDFIEVANLAGIEPEALEAHAKSIFAKSDRAQAEGHTIAITGKPDRRHRPGRGKGSDFAPSKGTGAGSNAQERPEIEISAESIPTP